jgi:hypothetical protein
VICWGEDLSPAYLAFADFQALANTAMFNPNYLHLDRK